jgi:hypothetical protein
MLRDTTTKALYNNPKDLQKNLLFLSLNSLIVLGFQGEKLDPGGR